jgi:hypothetical protein
MPVHNHSLLLACFAAAVGTVFTSCDNSNRHFVSTVTPTAGSVAGAVLTSWGDAVAGATVYLIPGDKINMTPITAPGILNGNDEPYDEPLEDLVTSGTAKGFPHAETGATGAFAIANVDTTKRYFPFVDVNGATPADIYSGGNLSRVALTGAALTRLDIEVSGRPSSKATYVGSSLCLMCHSDFTSQKTHAHRLGFRSPGKTTGLQDLSRHPGFDDGLAYFKVASKPEGGTALYYLDYKPTGFDRFRIASSNPGGAEIEVRLWRDSTNGRYKITMSNLVNKSDPARTYEVDLTYGGAVYKQRFMLKVPNAGYKGRYPFLQYQHAGDDAFYDRTRQQWRDYHMDFFWNPTTKLFKFPDKVKSIESNCLACHATGYRYFTDSVTGERMCDAVNDRNGAFDIDGDSAPDEINTGCEVCHGPGSEHIANIGPRHIVKPSNLSASREAMICGRCHDRVAGNDDRKNDQPLNAQGEMMMPGRSRADFLAEFTSRKGPKLSSFWADQFHSKSHHQQYPDFIKSMHHRNGKRLLACSNCHDLHGKGAYDGNLTANPHDGSLCAQCHSIDMSTHLMEKTGSPKVGRTPDCTDCHYYKTAKTGAGRKALMLGTPTGASSDALITYWKNDISSHHTVVPYSNNVGVIGVVPGKAMPIPFTNDCAVCHNAQLLQHQK